MSYQQFDMRLLIIIIISLTLLTFCKTPEDNNAENEVKDVISDSNNCVYSRTQDSLDINFVPLYDNKEKGGRTHPVTRFLLDSLLKYKKIRSLISDSSATIYLLYEIADGEDTCKKTISLNKQRMRIDIRNFDKSYYYLCLSYSYKKKSIYVLNNCISEDSCSLADWDKNCW